jgi:cell division protein FtsB
MLEKLRPIGGWPQRLKLVTAALLALLAVVQFELWFGKGSLPRVAELQRKVDAQKASNAEAKAANDRLGAEVRDLKEGLEMVEEKARLELGMVKPDEVLVQITRK